MTPVEQPPLIEPHSGIRFPTLLTVPGDTTPQWLAGAGIQQATLFRINVYAFGLYGDRDAARAALADYAGRPATRLAEDETLYHRLLELEFAMSLRLVLARDLSGADIAKAFDQALRPRLERRQGAAGAHDSTALQRNRGYFAMDRLGKGAEILFCYRPTERLTVPVAGTVHQPLRSRTLCEVLFDLYLGAEALSEQGRRRVIASFPALLADAHDTRETAQYGEGRSGAAPLIRRDSDEPMGDARGA